MPKNTLAKQTLRKLIVGALVEPIYQKNSGSTTIKYKREKRKRKRKVQQSKEKRRERTKEKTKQQDSGAFRFHLAVKTMG